MRIITTWWSQDTYGFITIRLNVEASTFKENEKLIRTLQINTHTHKKNDTDDQ